MGASEVVKALLTLSGKKQIDLAAYFGMSKQTMGNKMARNSWSAADLARVADFCECKLLFEMSNGQKIFFDSPPDKGKGPDETPGLQE